MPFCCLLIFIFNEYFQKILLGILSEWQTVLSHLSCLIWVQTVCKGYQQKTKIKSITSRQSYNHIKLATDTIYFLPAKSDIDVMFCLQSYQGLIIDRSLVY